MVQDDGGTAPRGRPARISRQDIARAALDIGLPSVTLAGIAERLGVDHSSLYRHVRGRNDILVEAANLALAQLEWRNSAADWRDFVETLAGAVWKLYARYPGLADVLRDLDVNPAAGLRAFIEAARELRTFGFSSEDAILILDSVIGMTGEAFAGWNGGTPRSSSARTIGEPMISAWQREVAGDGEALALISAMTELIGGDPEVWWRRKLAMLLDGAAYRRQSRADASSA